jgi:aminoglycoside N3'-acetyltransferase
MPGVRRSMHIFSSVAAYGHDAEYITQWHYGSPGGPGTPYWKIIELKGYSFLWERNSVLIRFFILQKKL